MKKTTCILLLIGFVYTNIGMAQKLSKEEKKARKEVKKNEPPKKGDTYFTPIPVLSSNPSFGIVYGLAASTSKYMGDPTTTKLSSMSSSVAFTTLNQTLIVNKATIYLKDNSYKIDTDWRYLQSNQATYGLGSGPFSRKLASSGFQLNDEGAFSSPIDEKNLLGFNWFRLYQTVSKQINDGFYLGLGYHLDILNNYDDGLLDIDTTTPAITSFYAYNAKYGFAQDKSTLSGISLNTMYDTRDNLNTPYAGRYAQLTFRVNPDFLGSDKSSTSLWAEYRDYFDLTKDHKNMLAFWFYGSLQTSGALPYMNLPAINYDQYSTSGRGYTQGRIRGQQLLYSEIEYRKKIWGPVKNPDMIGLNFFANVSTATNKDADIGLFDYLDPGYGAGLRIMLSPKSRTSLSIDYAKGKYGSSGIYLALNEFF